MNSESNGGERQSIASPPIIERNQFEVVFIPQKGGGFTVEVPDLPGCVSEGNTLDEAHGNIQEAIELYLETLVERKIPLPERRSSKMFRTQIAV